MGVVLVGSPKVNTGTGLTDQTPVTGKTSPTPQTPVATPPVATPPATGLVKTKAEANAAKATGGSAQPQVGATHDGPQQAGGGALGFLAAKRKKGVQDAAAPANQATGGVATALPLESIGALKIDRASGVAFQLDADKVQAQRVNVRKIQDPVHGEGLEINLKLRRGEDMREVEDRLKAAGGSEGTFQLQTMKDRGDGTLAIDPAATTSSLEGKAWNLNAEGKYQVDLMDNSAAQAARGTVRVRVFGKNPAERSANAKQAIETAGLGTAMDASSADSRERLDKMRVLWQASPKAAQELAGRDLSQVPMAEIDGALRQAGVSDERIQGIQSREVFPGHFTSINPGQAKEYEAHGVKYLFSGVRTKESVAAILKSDGMMSTLERYQRGMIVPGASSAQDIRTGGADYVFTRMVTGEAAGKRIADAYGAGDYQLVYKNDILDRTDWFAYNGDKYGNTKDEVFASRLTGKALVDSVGTGGWDGKFAVNNEVMFQRGISGADVDRIMTPSQEKKDALIATLTEAGITQVGGKPLAQAIEVRTTFLDAD